MNRLQTLKIALLIVILAEEIKRAKEVEHIKCDVYYIKNRFTEFDNAMKSVSSLVYAYSDE
ncbi:hypothetical protein CW676_02245 [Macrococcoides caseolyticum]|uniref:hypothetical protein n=1 Tax=Macrococcoides caseolyticum TaxID=69966 RepID=UPI000C33097D|nr:hypothetical protein [Macrococcus caseolyticus]PKE07336.1 hypothetical protein CW692_03475 [Macrococcus caseolyticus]PKE34659.1 hypothetical protein CW668_00225 [Macrococcus caseolyticus]PKE54077.1 hypothetical protein CW676_02245 [Macrococcus caseolyticus]PKF39160.1 hypothetical protein CW681_02575 [Macrococcus caseolyticus]